MKHSTDLVKMFSDKISILNLTMYDCWTTDERELRYKECGDEYGIERYHLIEERDGYSLFLCKDNGEEFYAIGHVDNLLSNEAYDEWEEDE